MEGEHLMCISNGERSSHQLEMVLDGKVLPSIELPTNGNHKVIRAPIIRSWNGKFVECRYSNELYTEINRKFLIVKCEHSYHLFFVFLLEVVVSRGNVFSKKNCLINLLP